MKKGVYVNGHERPDVVKYCHKYLAKMEEYERCVFTIVNVPCSCCYLADMSVIADKWCNTT